MLLSLCIHAAALAIRFTGPAAPAARPADSLEVTLVNAHTDAAPIRPDILAQAQIDGGGNETGYAASPLPRTADAPADEVVLAALRKRQKQLEAEQNYLYTQLESRQQVLLAHRRADQSGPAPDPGTDDAQQESVILNAQISAIKERVERYNAQPRREFAAPSAAAVDYAQYVEAWRQKIELLGTEHYPAEARGRIYGDLQLTVYIKKDGQLERVEIDRPSDHAVLNLAARRIVQLAAPFAPFPPSLAGNTDVLAITRTWNFVNDQLDTTTP